MFVVVISMNKPCPSCKLDKSYEDYHRNARHKDGLQTTCKECHKATSRASYLKNRDKHKAAVRERNTRLSIENRRKVWEYLLAHPCVHCGETDPVVLEFDHLDPALKTGTISSLSRGAWSWERIMIEIDKCQVLCANCHRRKTAKQFDHHAYLVGWTGLEPAPDSL